MINAVIDISHHNRVTSFSQVKEDGIEGVIHKATQGAGYSDPTFATNRQQATDAGLLFGAYHFGTGGDPITQAEHFLSKTGIDSLLVLDFEDNPQGATMSLQEAERFVAHVKEETGRYPGLYSGNTIREALAAANITGPEQTILSQCWLWIARYGANPTIPPIWTEWTLWQYTDGSAGSEPHTVNGIGKCDRDMFNGTITDLQAFWGQNSD